MKIEIDHDSLERYRKVYQALEAQLQTDSLINTGAPIHREDVRLAALVCLIKGLFKVVEE